MVTNGGYKTSESEIKDFIGFGRASSMSISRFISILLAPKSHRGNAQGPRWILHTQLRDILLEEPAAFMEKQ